jgi:hypothetical protein
VAPPEIKIESENKEAVLRPAAAGGSASL